MQKTALFSGKQHFNCFFDPAQARFEP